MITLKRNNVVKIVDSEEKANLLKNRGFVVSDFIVDTTKQIEETSKFVCDICNKSYKTKKGLTEHKCKGAD